MQVSMCSIRVRNSQAAPVWASLGLLLLVAKDEGMFDDEHAQQRLKINSTKESLDRTV